MLGAGQAGEMNMGRPLIVVALISAVFLLAGVAWAGKPSASAGSGFVWQRTWTSIAGTVEQQPGVHNPTTDGATEDACVWDVDDFVENTVTDALLSGGESVTETMCLIADRHADHPVWIQLSAQKATLTVTLTVNGTAHPVSPVPAGNVWWYELCVYPPRYLGSNVIPGSNGGVGEQRAVSVTVANPTSQTVRKIRGGFQFPAIPFWPLRCPR